MNTYSLSENDVDSDPFVQFSRWYDEHLRAGIAIPESVSLGTASADGKVSVRTVLLKGFDVTGFIFFTNYGSRKGTQLSENPYAAMLFYWMESGRQVRIEGKTERISENESSEYFSTRPRESQLSAWASEQSAVIPDRLHLEESYDYYKALFENKAVTKPPHWGGYRLIPHFFEFWLDGQHRLHDRLIYQESVGSWIINRLAP
jgi:pyridoxamine 5'-phosphate oxidase